MMAQLVGAAENDDVAAATATKLGLDRDHFVIGS